MSVSSPISRWYRHLPPRQRTALRMLSIYGLVSISVIIMVFPIFWMFLSSVKPPNELFATPPSLIPTEVTFEHFETMWIDMGYGAYMVNSLLVALVTTAVTTITASMAAYSLTRFDFPGADKMAKSVLVMYLLPPIMFVIPLFLIFSQLNLNDTLIAVALGHITYALPFSIWLLRAFFESLPSTYEEAAMVEGASRIRAIRSVVLPLSVPGIATIAIFAFTVSWNDYLFALTFISSDSLRTLPLALGTYQSSDASQWGVLVAISVLTAIPPLAAILFIKDYLLEGFGIAG